MGKLKDLMQDQIENPDEFEVVTALEEEDKRRGKRRRTSADLSDFDVPCDLNWNGE